MRQKNRFGESVESRTRGVGLTYVHIGYSLECNVRRFQGAICKCVLYSSIPPSSPTATLFNGPAPQTSILECPDSGEDTTNPTAATDAVAE